MQTCLIHFRLSKAYSDALVEWSKALTKLSAASPPRFPLDEYYLTLIDDAKLKQERAEAAKAAMKDHAEEHGCCLEMAT